MEFSGPGVPMNVPGDILVKLVTLPVDPGMQVGPHTHYTLELSMILSGEGEYRVEDRVYPAKEGDIFIFNNTESHGLFNTGKEPIWNLALEFEPRFIWSDPFYAFDPSFLGMFFSRSRQFENKLDRENPAYPAVRRQFEEIQAEFYHHLPRYEMVVKAKLLGLLADLLRHYDLVDDAPTAGHRHHEDMHRVLTYIAEHFAEPLPIEMLADMLHVNESYFCQLFRKSNGLSPKEYIIKVRTVAAAKLLKETDRSVLEIAEGCGFNSPSNFYAAFKRITGKSPQQYRRNPLD